MSLKGIFSGRDLLSFHCKKLFIAAWLTPRAGRRKEGRQAGQPRRQPGVGGGFGPHLAQPRQTTRRDRGSGPTRSQRVPAAADAEAPQLTTSLRGPRRRRRRLTASFRAVELGGRAARGRRQLTGGTAPQKPPPPPKEPKPERAGPGRPSPGQRLPPEPGSPPSAAPPATVPQAFGEGRGRMGVPPHLGPFLVVVVSGNFIKSVSLFLCLPLPEEPELPPRSG